MASDEQYEFERQQLTSMRTAANNLLQAITALQNPLVLEYQLNTGQTTTKVTRADLSLLIGSHRKLLVEIENLDQRVNGGGYFFGS